MLRVKANATQRLMGFRVLFILTSILAVSADSLERLKVRATELFAPY
jgi:hypothetical protein